MIATLLLLVTLAPPQTPPTQEKTPSIEEMATGKGLLWACSRALSADPKTWGFPEGFCAGQLRSIEGMVEVSRLRAAENFRQCNRFCELVNGQTPITPPRVCADVCDLAKTAVELPLCPPASSTVKDAARAVVSYLEANPAEQAKAAITVAMDALLEKFPCHR